MLPDFELYVPHSLQEALKYLSENAPSAVPIAGGTNLTVDMRSGRHHPKVLVAVDRLTELKGIHRDNGNIAVGSGTCIADLLNEPLISQHAPALVQAARVFANPLIRNRATVGGNLSDASPAADSAPPLLIADAEVELMSQAGSRRVPLAEFFIGVRKTQLKPGELIKTVYFPIASPQCKFGYYKLGLRKADAISVVSVAVMLEGQKGRCTRARIALGSVAPVPTRALAAEEALRNQPIGDALLSEAARLAAESASPISDLRSSADYRRRMVAVLVRRLLDQVTVELK
jgi:CO/xanthine dehydrogenase FAD-binding subunit